MIRKLLLILLLLAFENSSAQNYFSKYYNQNNTYLRVLPAGQESFMNVSTTSSTTILKTDSLYNILWAKTFNPFASLQAVGPDNSIYLLNTDTAIVKADSAGNVLWARKVSDPVIMQGGQFGTALL